MRQRETIESDTIKGDLLRSAELEKPELKIIDALLSRIATLAAKCT